MKTTILIADGHTLVRETWSYILSSNPLYTVVGEAASGEAAVDMTKSLSPDIVIMDINLPGMSGIEATQLIRKLSPGSKVLGVSLHTQPTYARKMIQKGAWGYVTKNSTKEEMFLAIAELQKGNKYICKEIKNILSQQMISDSDVKKDINDLSQREIEIIGFLKKGATSKEIADALDISIKTVEVHRYNILKKLNLKNTAGLVNFIHNSELTLNE